MSNAIVIFDGTATAAAAIVDALKKVDLTFFDSPWMKGVTPEEYLKTFTRQQLLDHLLSRGLKLEAVLPIDWNGKDKQEWLDKMLSNSFGISSMGNTPPRELLLETFIRLEALNELCMPPEKNQSSKMDELRRKYRTAVNDF